MRIVTALLAALRFVTRTSATAAVECGESAGEAAYWAEIAAARNADEAELAQQELRDQLYLEWLEECDAEAADRQLRVDLYAEWVEECEAEARLRDAEEFAFEEEEDQAYLDACEDADRRELEYLNSEHRFDDEWRRDHMGDGLLG